MSAMRCYDLSQPIESAMPVFPGDPEVRLEPSSALAPWRVTRLTLGSHSGTHVDAPAHYFSDGRSITDYPVERFFVPAVVIPFPELGEDEPIPAAPLLRMQERLRPGSAVLLATGWDRYWGTERYFRHPFLSEEAVDALVAAGVGLVGIDALNVDSTVRGTEHAHARLLGADVLIVENLRGLAELPPSQNYLFVCLPLAVRGADGAPVRAVACEWDGEAERVSGTSG
uniref:Cyclase family protein n=1 Tax=Thermomicrobium roseum TaxID=500 RepID=A0A7C1XJC4_THERO